MILAADQFVLGVGLSHNHYVVVEPASGFNNLPKVLDQAVGFLTAHGARISRVRLRCPMMWFADAHGEFEWNRCLIYFVRHFLSTDPTDPPWIPPMIWPVTPLGVIASAGVDHWKKVNEILEGVEAAGSDLLVQLATALAAMVWRWEYYMARMVVLSQRAGEYDANDRDLVLSCDRLLWSIVSRFAPGYELLPVTITRLL
jgi:hypothetical protein